MRVACVLLSSAVQLKILAEASLRLSPQVALGERWIFIEVAGCRHLYSEASCRLRLKALTERLGLSARITIADDPATALAAAFYPNTKTFPIECLPLFANPFTGTSTMDKTVLVLKQLGIQTLEHLKTFPTHSLTPRFGKPLALALHHLQRGPTLPWPRFHLPEQITESMQLQEDCRLLDLEPVLFLLKNLVDQIVLRLRGRWQLAAGIELKLTTEKYSVVKKPERLWQMNLAFPQGGTLGILSLLKERLQTSLAQEPLESPLRHIELKITDTVISPARQRNFFSKKEEELEQTQTIISRLVDRFGTESVFLASPQQSFVPEKSWTKTLETFTKDPDLFSAVAKRPLRLLKSPLPLKKIENQFVSMHRRWRILESHGPERISGEWWHKDQERDYFHIKTEAEVLWVYKVPATQSYFLHGIFD